MCVLLMGNDRLIFFVVVVFMAEVSQGEFGIHF